jgi:siroheme decarboxylase
VAVDLTARLLEATQQGLPLVERPFLAIAEQLGVTEREVLDLLTRLQSEGVIREFSAFLDPKRLGYCSTLACMKVPDERVEAVAALLADMPEVTHNYLRDHELNMWFTVIVPSREAVGRLLDSIAERSGCGPIHDLPAETLFKIRVAFRADEMMA